MPIVPTWGTKLWDGSNIGGERIIGMGTITGNAKNALVLGGFGQRQL